MSVRLKVTNRKEIFMHSLRGKVAHPGPVEFQRGYLPVSETQMEDGRPGEERDIQSM